MSSCDPCDPSLGSLEDIFLAQIYCADLTFVVFFLLSFVVIYSLNVTYIASFSSFQSFFPCVLLSLSSTFYLSSLYVFLSISSTFSFCLCLSFTFFLAAFYLSPLTFFVYHLIFLSASISFFVFYFPSLLSSTFILCLSSILFPLLLTFLFILLRICVCVLWLLLLLLLLLSFLSSCSFLLYFLPIF